MLGGQFDRLPGLNRFQYRVSNGETSCGVACVDQGLGVTPDDFTEVFELCLERVSRGDLLCVLRQGMLPADGIRVVVSPDVQPRKGQSAFGAQEEIAVFRGLEIERVFVGRGFVGPRGRRAVTGQQRGDHARLE